jgi:integrase/recombinase XerD
MTAAGLRSLFRYHRRTTGIKLANPHRFRHTFASDMVRAGLSLPALMQLMGHADIETTLLLFTSRENPPPVSDSRRS